MNWFYFSEQIFIVILIENVIKLTSVLKKLLKRIFTNDYSVAIVDLSGDDKNLFSPNFNVNFLKYSNVN